jgi:hypothetical protein
MSKFEEGRRARAKTTAGDVVELTPASENDTYVRVSLVGKNGKAHTSFDLTAANVNILRRGLHRAAKA